MTPLPRPSASGLAGPTVAYRNGPTPSSAGTARKCRVAGACGATGSQFHTEIETLLRGRLRVAVLILLAPTIFFLVKNLVVADPGLAGGGIGRTFHVVVTAGLSVLAGLVWL